MDMLKRYFFGKYSAIIVSHLFLMMIPMIFILSPVFLVFFWGEGVVILTDCKKIS